MTGEEEQANSPKTVCPYYRVGYCKYKNKCRLFHPKENCGDRKGRDKACIKRHRKSCKFGQTCSRKEYCEFLHDQQVKVNETIKKPTTRQLELEETIKEKDNKIEELSEKVKTLEKSFSSMLEKIKSLTTNEQGMRDKVKAIESIQKKVDQNTAKIESVDNVLGQFKNQQEECKNAEEADNPEKMCPKNSQTLQPNTWLGRCGICKFRTTDRAHYKRHMETFVHKTKVY